MAFPLTPTNGDTHTEGNISYEFNSAVGGWLKQDLSGAGGTDLIVVESPTGVEIQSSSGTNDSIELGTQTNAGVMSPADKTKLDGIETGAAADQNAAEVPFTPAAGVAATDVQAAIAELGGDVQALQSVTGQNLGTVATSAALDALADPDGTVAIEDNDFAILGVDEGGREAGIYVASGGSFPATPAYQFPDNLVFAAATLVSIAGGAAGTASTVARSDHQHDEPVGAALPLNDGTAGRRFISDGSGALPAGDYVLPVVGQPWVQA